MKLTITQTDGSVLSLGFGGAGAPASLATAPLLPALATDHVLIERNGVLVQVSVLDLLTAVLQALPTDMPAAIGAPWLDGGTLAVVQP